MKSKEYYSDNIRKTYMLLHFRGPTIGISHIRTKRGIEVTFEQGNKDDIDEFTCTLDGDIVYRKGFRDSDIGYFLRFVKRHKVLIEAESRGEL